LRNKELVMCANCIYFEPIEDNRGFIQIGLCRRNAPTIAGFPRQEPDDECGEGKVDENRTQAEGDIQPELRIDECINNDPYFKDCEILSIYEDVKDTPETPKTDEEILKEMLGQTESKKKN